MRDSRGHHASIWRYEVRLRLRFAGCLRSLLAAFVQSNQLSISDLAGAEQFRLLDFKSALLGLNESQASTTFPKAHVDTYPGVEGLAFFDVDLKPRLFIAH